MVAIRELIPNPEDLLALDVSELAGVLLEHLNSFDDYDGLHHYNFFNDLRNYPPYEKPDNRINEALMEAWDWLLYEGFLAKRGDDGTRAGTFITRRGRRIKSKDDFEAYRKASLLPRGHLRVSNPFIEFFSAAFSTALPG
jgi:hypothetical protein